MDEFNDWAREGGNGLLCQCANWKRMVVGYYCGTLRYANLYADKDLHGNHGEGVMSVKVKEFQMYAVYICNDMKDSNIITLRWFPHGSILSFNQ